MRPVAGSLGSEVLVRALLLYVPVLATAWVWIRRRPDRRWASAAVVATIWNVPALLAANAVSVHMGWTSFGTSGPMVLGMPVDLGIGWALLWGAFPVLAFRRSVVLPVAALLLLDWITMPYAAPVVMLDRQWLLGEALTVAVALVPGLVLGRLTQFDRALRVRATMQMIGFGALAFGVLPLAVLEATTDSVTAALAGARWWVAAAAAPVLVVGASAAAEFARRGAGTPIPFDPPRRLVTSGPYAYVANPMQLSGTAGLFLLALAVRSGWLAATAALGALLGSGLFGWSEAGDLRDRFGGRYAAYRRQVGSWRPRWRPAVTGDPARLYISQTCDQCRATGQVLARLRPRGLVIEPAEACPIGPRTRATYVPAPGGRPETGIAALARAVEHVHLGWALLSFTVRLPVVRPVVQLVADLCGFGPRAVPWTPPAGCEAPALRTAGGSVLARVLRPGSFEHLPPPVREVLLGSDDVEVAGEFDVTWGGLPARVLARLLRLPRPGAAVPTSLHVVRTPGVEHWHRTFGGAPLATRQRVEERADGSRLLVESRGPLDLLIAVEVRGDGLDFTPAGARVRIGPVRVALPAALAPAAGGRDWVQDGVHRAFHAVSWPPVGEVLRYAGAVRIVGSATPVPDGRPVATRDRRIRPAAPVHERQTLLPDAHGSPAPVNVRTPGSATRPGHLVDG